MIAKRVIPVAIAKVTVGRTSRRAAKELWALRIGEQGPDELVPS